MPIPSPHRLLRAATLLLAAVLAGIAPARAPAQTLARPGWAGSGMNAAPWWKHAVIYRADPHGFGGLHGLAAHLDYIHSIGVDALLLTQLGSGTTQAAADPTHPVDPSLGTLDDLDEIVRRASEYNIRVLVELNSPTPDPSATARLWLAHGIAGFYTPAASPAQLTDLRKATQGFAGQRIVIGDLTTADPPPARNAEAPQLLADGRAATQDKLTAANARPALEAAQATDHAHTTPLLLSDDPALKRSITRYGDGTHDTDIAKQLAALLLTTRSAAMLFYGQELGLTGDASSNAAQISFDQPKKGEAPTPTSVAAEDASTTSLLNWYRQLSALAHSNRTIGSGAMITLNHDDQNVLAWVRRPQTASPATPAIVVLENLSAQPVTLSLKADMQRLHLRGSFLRTVLRTDDTMGAMHLDSMTLPPFGVFIGELRY